MTCEKTRFQSRSPATVPGQEPRQPGYHLHASGPIIRGQSSESSAGLQGESPARAGFISTCLWAFIRNRARCLERQVAARQLAQRRTLARRQTPLPRYGSFARPTQRVFVPPASAGAATRNEASIIRFRPAVRIRPGWPLGSGGIHRRDRDSAVVLDWCEDTCLQELSAPEGTSSSESGENGVPDHGVFRFLSSPR